MRPPFAREQAPSIRPEINVTPLVDVVLVLLIIFMVVLPSMQDEGRPIEMVKVLETDTSKTGGPEPVVVTVTEDEQIFVDDQPASAADLQGLLEARTRASGAAVLLRGDSRVPYQVMRSVFAQVQASGATGVRLAVGAQRTWTPPTPTGGARHGDEHR